MHVTTAYIVKMTVVWYILAVALGFGAGRFSVRSFHRKYRVTNRRWLRFVVGVPLLLGIAWILGEFNAFYLTLASSYFLTLAVGGMLWLPSAASDRTSPSAS
jgi:hypothetical protein